MQKYIGRIVKIVYQDQCGNFSQRQIQVWAVRGNVVRAYCLERQAPRIFLLDRILAVVPVIGRAV